ncbi:hypothetical protein QBC44DRAFT_361793 [Cladorrhinum sp. PSN332]|nr:hypothetical protein QBC44DRAFT_361793 [Cladorrhinum sp. PSN332]
MNKKDQYLGFCLEQAILSPLFNRHGAIVVKGGKVIGRGFNDYRPGFDGGALKTGRLPSSASLLDHIAMANLKRKSKPDISSNRSNTTTFSPFENLEAGNGSHTGCFTMHSEMMAINSALLSSTTLRATSLSHLKPASSRRERAPDRVSHWPAGRSGVLTRLRMNATRGGRRKPNGNRKQNNDLGSDEDKTSPAPHTGCDMGSSEQRSKTATFKGHSVVPASPVGKRTVHLPDRAKSRKLVGADVYVVRLDRSSSKSLKNKPPQHAQPNPPPPQSSPPGSLHDELTCKKPATAPPRPDQNSAPRQLRATNSRPCYRCVAYMHNAGIKRVFWTNAEGRWEGAKLRDLVDVLKGSSNQGEDSATMGVFVTKHEVLRLKRLMEA